MNEAPEFDAPTDKIEIHHEAIPGFRTLVPMPSQNPAIGGAFEITGFEGWGVLLRWTDPFGSVVWERFLRGADE